MLQTDRQTDRQTEFCHTCGHRFAKVVLKNTDAQSRYTLFANDFRDIESHILSGSVDAVISDPPYGSGGFMLRDILKSSKAKYVRSDASYQKTLLDIDGDALHPLAWRQLMTDACLLAKKVLTDNGVLALFIDWRNLGALMDVMHQTGFTLRGTVVWNKGNASRPMKNGWKNQAEFLVWATKGKMPVRDEPVYLPGVLSFTTMTNNKVHITQKPEALMTEIVKICPPSGTVFDPFMGSGTTGVAALKAGLKFIGCETVPQYFDTAVSRCEAVFY